MIIVGSSFKEGIDGQDAATTPRAWCAPSTCARGKTDLARSTRFRKPGEFGSDTWEERFVASQRQHRRVDADHRRRRSRTRLSAGRIADLGFLRRPAPGNNLFAESAGRGRSQDRRPQVALPVRAPSDLGSRHVVGAAARGHDVSTASRARSSRCRASKAVLYVFDRITGQPIWPIEETPVPQSDGARERRHRRRSPSRPSRRLTRALPRRCPTTSSTSRPRCAPGARAV